MIKKRKLTRLRTADKRAMELFPKHGKYACERSLAREYFETRNAKKPRYAVMALVLLRDHGTCYVCNDPVGSSFDVVRRLTTDEGGIFDEPNCVLLCRECALVWNPYKNFHTSRNTLTGDLDQLKYTLRRRDEGRKGCKGLSRISQDKYRRVLDEAVTVTALAKRPIGVSAESLKTIQDLINRHSANLLNPANLDSSDNEVNKSAESDTTEV
jgi:hypothetical protein